MKKTPTIDEIIEKHFGDKLGLFTRKDVESIALEVSKLHVEAALKEASENAKAHRDSNGEWVSSNVECYVNKDSILSSYPLDKIK